MAMLKHPEKIIFEYSRPKRGSYGQWPTEPETPNEVASDIPENLRRKKAPLLPEVSELEVVRHFTRLSRLNFSIDQGLYPLGSCTMKHNPRTNEEMARLPGFAAAHPLAPESVSQGALELAWRLERILAELTGLSRVTLQPSAGAQGELAWLPRTTKRFVTSFLVSMTRSIEPSVCPGRWKAHSFPSGEV